MSIHLAGTRPGHALFTQDSRAVVVELDTMTASAVFPDYEVIPAQWESDADPALVPTRAFALADDALADVVAVTASGKRSGKRTYAVPKNVRDTASRALAQSLGNPVERSVAASLTAGKPVSFDLVHHVSLYFSRGLTASADLWGGEAGARWAEKIAAKELAIRAAAAAPHDLGLSERGAKNPAPADEAIEDDPGPEVVWGDVDPTETHVFSPLSVANPYDCAYCFAPEGALLHTDSMRAQVIANYGEDSPELAAYDEYLATFDEPSEEALTAKPVSAAGRFAADSPRGAASLVAAAFFHDADDCEYHAEHDRDADEIHRIYGHWGDDTWRAWNPQAKDWEDAGDASDADLEPIDDNSAYVVAMRQAENGGGPVPVRDVHTMEWAAADDARADIDDEVGGFEEMDPDFYVETDEEDDTHVNDLYAQRSGLWFRWDAKTADWVASPEPVNVSEIDEEDAEQVARWLSWGREGMDPGDDSVTAAARRKTGTRAQRANQPGQVPRPSSRVRGSERSPYSSWSTSPGSSWFRKAGKPSEFFAPGKYGPGSAEIAAEDGNYTPEERAANAKKQVRDAYGRFAKGGSEIDTAKGTGTIVKINPDTQQIQVRYPNGATAWVDAKQTRVHGANEKSDAKDSSPYRTTNDGGEVWLPADGPRATKYTPKAYLSKLQKPLTSAELDKMLADTSRYFAEERARAKRINRNWNSSDAITASANHDGVMVAFFLPPDQAASHALEGGEPAESLHLTLAYLGSMDEVPGGAQDLLRVVGEWAQGIAPVSGEISGSGVFVNGEKPVTHLSVDCSDLPAVRQSLIEHLEANGYSPRKDHGFDPHITLAYDDVPVEVTAEPVHFNDVVVSFGPNDMAIPLGGMAMSAAGEEKALTPDTSDVKPINMAIVDTVDKSAVLELLSLVPASTTSTTPVLFKRTAKGWERDDNMLSSLRSAAPPPVVTLDEQTFPDVLKQVDATLSGAGQEAPAEQAPVAASGAPELYNEYGELLPALVAAAGQAVTPKDFAGAERLKRYWTVGPGGAKIRWGQGGDFNRCVKHLTKYLGPRAKGYCQLRHHDVLGFYTGTHAKMLKGGRRGVRGAAFELTDEQVATELQAVRERLAALPIVADAGGAGGGARFRIPIVVPEGVPTGDGRIFQPLSVTHRDLPIPLLWQIKTGDGHDGSVIVGRIDSMERVANGLGNAYGVFDTSPHGQEVQRLVSEGFLRGVSADLDNFEAQTEKAKELGEKKDDDESEKIGADKTTISKARVMAVTAVPKPAFQECTIEIVPDEPEQQEVPVIHDGVYSDREDEALVACAMVASQIPVTPPSDWFEDPMLREPTPLTVTDDGRVYGHIAAWHTDHIGLPFGTKPPRSRSNYAYFHTGVVRTEGGKDVPVGQLTLAGGHAGLELTADAAVKHYDDTHSAVADVHAGEDAHGIWVAGALRPDVDAAKIRTLRASAPSGDWRPINGRLELVAVCQVNVPGFPVARARVASGYVTALVAAGAAPLARMKGLSVEDRVQRLEQEALSAKMQAARERMAPALAEHAETLALRASAARERIESLRAGADTGYDAEQLEAFSRKGWALPNGSLAIANVADLRAAVVAYSSLAACDKPGARRHIMKRARGLGHVDLIPASWTSASVEERYQDARSTFLELAASKSLTASGSQVLPRVSAEDGDRGLLVKRDNVIERMKALRAAAKTPSGEFDAQRHPRWDENGQFRQVLTRLRKDVEDVPEAEEAVRNIDKAMELMGSSDLGKIEAATHDVMRSIDKAADLVGSAETAANMRTGFAALGEALARLPLPQGNDTATMRWTDLPMQLQSLVTDVMDKLKSELDADEYRKVTHDVQAFQSGVDFATSDQIQSWLSGMVSRLVA